MERNTRLVTGLILFSYAACHFASHATGLLGFRAADAIGRGILLAPWRTWAGHTAIFGSLFVHAGLGLRALYRRRHLRVPAAEAWQLGLGLSIPFLIIPHAVNVRIGAGLYGLGDTYDRILYQYWLTPPASGLVRQLTLLFVVWVHGCIGLHFWLRTRAWFGRWRLVLLAAAALLPFLAVLGLVNGGWNAALLSAVQPGFASAHGPPSPGNGKALALAAIKLLSWQLQLAWVALVGLVVLLRFARNRGAARGASGLRITYPNGRVVSVPRGFSVLEASRWARIPHASMCGGRGRCSTCRVRVARGLDGLPSPSPGEQETLSRIKASSSVRLACQLRPNQDVSVVPLLPASVTAQGARAAVSEGHEVQVTALFIDLRESTRLAANRLPFDALFIIDRYVRCVTDSVQAHGGHVTSVAGDGIMSVFGIGSPRDTAAGAADALRAALAIWSSLGRLSDELRAEIGGPLAFGMGLHSGVATVGSILVLGRPSVQFLGDTGNVAARLEALTKELDCTVIVSDTAMELAGGAAPAGAPRTEVRLRGREELPMGVTLLRRPEEVQAAIPPSASMAGGRRRQRRAVATQA